MTTTTTKPAVRGSAAKKLINGASPSVLYDFLQKDLQQSDPELFARVYAQLVAALGIWFRPSLYSAWPFLVPYAVRSSGSRGNKAKGLPDQWGAPDASGYVRDDNSLIKGLPRGLRVLSTRNNTYRGRSIGPGFVASHVWRTLDSTVSDATGAAYDPLTYSFVPNLVWIPGAVAGLTDRIDSFAQQYLQALSLKIFRSQLLGSDLELLVRPAWDRLPEPIGIRDEALPDMNDLNFFEETPTFVPARRKSVTSVSHALGAILRGESLSSKVVASRYTEGLPAVDRSELARLSATLTRYLEATAPSAG
jgi:hypothetical protein